MQIKTEGHEESYSVYTVLKSFFWFEKVSEKPSCDDGDTAFSKQYVKDGVLYIDTVITYRGNSYNGRACLKADNMPADELSYKRKQKDLIKRSAYDASAQALGHGLKWGILTGIRPAKLARDLRKANSLEKAHDILVNDYCLSDEKSSLILGISDVQNSIINEISHNDVSLYISIPFCVSRCSYCSFVSHSIEKAGHLVPQYVSLLIRELRELSELISSLSINIKSIYIGGGTPTSLSESELLRLLLCINECFDLSKVAEYTLEAGRADTITPKKLADAKRLGVTRVSVNPQTTNDDILMSLGRRHTRDDFFKAYRLSEDAGFDIINTDVIAGLPGESLDSFKRTIDDILTLSPANVTVHTLSVKRASTLNYDHVDITREFDLVSSMLSYASERLFDSGYSPYYLYRQKSTLGNLENVGYARAGAECLYNIYMMEEVMPVLGAGAGAVCKMLCGGGKIERIFNYKYPYEYINDFSKVARNHLKLKEMLSQNSK
ncbi:MAG: coproporphyrinogen dehydrogenase HemZ [Clostridia bacterium]|nr:coproporphyrinogen dehydrogenase HemZ [Clostridia bacterium]